METNTATLIQKLYRVEGQAEIVNGRIVRLPLHGWQVGHAVDAILFSLHEYAKQTENGYALGSTVAYLVDLPHRKAFCPDVAFDTGGEFSMKFPEGAPIFIAEVRDPRDYGPAAERRIATKRTDYFAAGTQVVWDVDVLREGVVRVYRTANQTQPTIYHRGEIAEAETALPDWTMPVDDLFP